MEIVTPVGIIMQNPRENALVKKKRADCSPFSENKHRIYKAVKRLHLELEKPFSFTSTKEDGMNKPKSFREQ